MKTFRFTLQAIETLRERAEHSALEKLADALRGQRSAQEQLTTVCSQITLHQQKHRELIESSSEINKVKRHGEWMHALQKERSRIDELCNVAGRQVDASVAALQSARQARETIARCHEQQRIAHLAECRRHEQKLLDEIASARHLRSARARAAIAVPT